MRSAIAISALAGLALASPAARRRTRDTSTVPHTHPLIQVSKSNATAEDVEASTYYSSNWSGIVLNNPAGTAFDSVTGTFNVPTVSIPPGGSSGTQYWGAAWVGIDGDTNQNALFQAGCNFITDGTTQQNPCWVEWIPNPEDYVNFSVNPGDSVTVTCTTTSTTSGTVTITDNTTGQSTTVPVSAPNSNAVLTGQNAEFIYEDLSLNGGLAPFAQFTPVTFSGLSADASGQTMDISGGDVWLLDQNGQQLTNVNVESGNQFEVTYQ